MELDLNKYKDKNVKVLSGRDNGVAVRKKINLDKVDKSDETVRVLVPRELYSLNSSFFLGLFGPSVRNLGEKQFRTRYIFDCDVIIAKNIEDGISRALKDSNPLRG